MGAATQITTFSDAYTDLLNRVRANTGTSATVEQAKRYINIALQDIHIGFSERFPWAERKAVLVTHPRYTTGTVTINQGGTSLTGATTAWSTANAFGQSNMRAGGKITFGGSNEVYEIASVGGDTSATLATQYIGSDLSGESYVYFEDEYALASDFLRPIDATHFGDGNPIPLVGRTDFRRRYTWNSTPGKIEIATIVDRPFSGSTTPVRKIMFFRPPTDAEIIPYTYVTANMAVTSAGAAQSGLVNDTDEPIIPLRYRHAIVLGALYHWYRDKKDDGRSQEAKAEYTDLVLRMASDSEIGAPRAAFRPHVSPYRVRASRPWRGGGRRFDVNSRFDRMEW